jgi:hypothetical protein
MPMTMPTVFLNNYIRDNAANNIIVVLYDGTNYYHFGTADMIISDDINYSPAQTVRIYGLLRNDLSLSQSVDVIWTKKWTVADVRISLLDVNHIGSIANSTKKRPSDLLQNCYWREAAIYFAAGSNVALLSDCLKRFVGIVSLPPKYDERYLHLNLMDKAKVKDRKIPNGLLSAQGDLYYPQDDGTRKVPIVYGEFALAEPPLYATNGLMRGLAIKQTSPDAPPKYIFSKHILHTATKLYCKLGSPDVLESLGDTLTVGPVIDADDSGLGTAYIERAWEYSLYEFKREFDCNITPPTGDGGYPEATSYPGTSQAVDENAGTSSDIKDNISDNSSNLQTGMLCWGIAEEDVLSAIALSGSLNSDSIEVKLYAKYGTMSKTGGSGTATATFRGYYKCVGSTSSYGATGALSLPIGTGATGLIWSNVTYPDKNRPFMIGCFISYANGSTVDGIVGDDSLAGLTEIDAVLEVFINSFGSVDMEIWRDAFLSGQGRIFGSWIDAAGWSNSKNAGDLIDDNNFVIASLLIDEMGLAITEIDQASFDEADDDTPMKCHLDIVDEILISDQIQEICEQSPFAFYHDGANKARLIPLDNITPTIDKVFKWNDLVPNTLTVSKTDQIVNQLRVFSRYQEEYGSFRDAETVNDSTSQSLYNNTFPGEVQWKNIAGAYKDIMTQLLITSGMGLWSRAKYDVQFELKKFLGVPLIMGDWFQLDHITVDPHRLIYGDSWEDYSFLIYGLIIKQDRTLVQGICLY